MTGIQGMNPLLDLWPLPFAAVQVCQSMEKSMLSSSQALHFLLEKYI